MLGSAARVDVIPEDAILEDVILEDVILENDAGHGEPDGGGLEACWRRSLETAGNLLCRLCPDEASTVSVVVPLSGQPREAERLEALGRRLANERELSFRAKQGSHSVTITFSNRV